MAPFQSDDGFTAVLVPCVHPIPTFKPSLKTIMKSLISTILLLCGTAPWAAATLINVDFNTATSPTCDGTGFVLGTTGDFWNGVNAKSASNLKDSAGAASTIGFNVVSSHFNGTTPFFVHPATSTTSPLGDYLNIYRNGSIPAATITLTGLEPLQKATIVLFGANSAQQGAKFTINGITKATADSNASLNPMVEGDEYVKFTDVIAAADGSVTIDWVSNGTGVGHNWSCLNGFQVQPEALPGPPNIILPSTVALTPDGTVQNKDITVSNSSADSPLSVTAVDFTGADMAAFSLVTSLPLAVPTGGNATLTFTFNPVGISGTVDAAMSVTSNDPDGSPTEVTITGQVLDPVAFLNPSPLDFGAMAPTDPASDLDLTITNNGWNNAMTLTPPTISDTPYAAPAASRFTLQTAPAASVAAGASTTATVRFDPAGLAGRAVALLDFETNDPAKPTQQVMLTAVTPLAAGALSDNFDAEYASSVWDNPWDASSFTDGRANFTGVDYTRRQYLRTVAADFKTIDFTVTATLNRGNNAGGDGCAFFGIGKGERNSGYFNEPSGSDAIYLRLRSNGWSNSGNILAEVNNGTAFTSFGLPNDATGNAIPVRMSFKAATSTATITLDTDGDGFETTDPTLTAVNTNLSPTDSHLFGGGSGGAFLDNVVVTLGVADPYTTWADGWADPVLSDKTSGGDPDFDGIPNLLEYVIGGDPRVSSTEFLPKQAIVGTNLVLTYKRSDASEADTTQTGQWSTNLIDWHPISPEWLSENGTDPDDMRIVIPLAHAAGGKLFGRLHVTQL
jgi:hypothetical protein